MKPMAEKMLSVRAGDQQAQEHADQRHRQRHHDGDGLQEGAELRGQDQVDQDHRQQQRLAGIGRALGDVLGRAAEDEAVARRQFGLGQDLLQVAGDLARGTARHVGGDLDFAVEVAPVDLRGADVVDDVGDLGDVDHARQAVGLGAGGEPDALQVGDAGAVVDRQADHDGVVLAVGRAPQAGLVAGEQGPQRLRDRRRAEAEVGGGVAAQPHREHRLGGLEVAVEVDEAGDCRGRGASRPARSCRASSMSGPCSESWSCFCTPPPGPPGMLIETRMPGMLARRSRNRLGELFGRALALLQRLQAQVQARLVLAGGIAGVDRAVGVVDLGELAHRGVDLAQLGLGVFQRRADRRLDRHDLLAEVGLGHELEADVLRQGEAAEEGRQARSAA